MTIRDTLAERQPLLDALSSAQAALQEAQSAAKALKEALTDLEDQAMQDILDDPSLKNESARKTRLAALLRTSEPFQATKKQFETAQRAERQERVRHDDAERALTIWGKTLQALGFAAQEEAARLSLEGYTRFAEGASKVLAARQVPTRA